MSFGVITINYKRPQILNLFGASIKRLRSETGIDFPVIVVSEPEDKAICDRYNLGHIIHPNIPVTEKWNAGCGYMRELGVDYVIISGSDDVFSTDCMRNIIKAMESDPDLIAFKTVYVYDTDGFDRGTLLRVTSRGMLGVGKTINKRVLDEVNWRPWEYHAPRNWGMDSILHRNISPHVKTTEIVEGMIVDCKSKDSLNKFNMFRKNYHGIPHPKGEFFSILSHEERDILNGIIHIGVPVKFPNLRKKGRTLP